MLWEKGMNILTMLMAGSAGWTAWHNYIKYILLVIMALSALFVIFVVLFQPGNSSGISALGGQTETFLSKNKGKTFDHKMKVMTAISGIVFAVLCIVFAIIAKLASL